jgi:hypothetical protein
MTDEVQATNPTEDISAAASAEVETNNSEVDTDSDTSTSDQSTDQANTEVQTGDTQQTDTPVDDSEEIEHEGQKLKIPKAVKPLLMMQADYTRKTQEVAEQRKAVEAEREAVANQAKAEREYIQELAQLTAYDNAIKQYANVNWQQLNAQDPVQAQSLWFQYEQLRDGRNAVAGQIQQKETTRKQQEEQKALEAQQATAKQIQECYATVAREIKGWSPELIKQLDKTASEMGFTNDELRQVKDPRFIKLLHEAHLGRQLLKKQTAPTPPKQPPAKPLPTVGGNAPAKKDPDRMSMEEYVKYRNEQLRKK